MTTISDTTTDDNFIEYINKYVSDDGNDKFIEPSEHNVIDGELIDSIARRMNDQISG